MNPLFAETQFPLRGHCLPSTGKLRTQRMDLFAKPAFLFLWLFVFSVPWENSILVPGFGTVARSIGVVAFGLGALGIIERRYMKWPGLGFLLLAVFVAWSSATYFWSINPQATTIRINTYCQLLGAAFLVFQFCTCRQRLTRLIQAYLLGTCVSSIGTIINYYLTREAEYHRYAATGFNANDLGYILALSLPFSYQMAVESRGVRSWFYRLHLVLATTAILLTASRGALVASVVALGIVPATALLRRPRRAVAVTLVVGGLVIGAVWFIVPETSWQRLGTITTEVTKGTLDSRLTIWAAGLKVLPLRPFLGVGSGAYEDSITPILGRPETGHFLAHNTYLSILVECGLVGFFMMILLVLVLVRHVAALPSARRMVWTFCLLTLATCMTCATWEDKKPLWVLLSLCLAESARRVRIVHNVTDLNKGRARKLPYMAASRAALKTEE